MYKHHLYAVFLRQTRVFPAVCRRFLLTMARRSRQIVFTPVWAHGVAKCHLGNVGPGGGSGSGRGRVRGLSGGGLRPFAMQRGMNRIAFCGLLHCGWRLFRAAKGACQGRESGVSGRRIRKNRHKAAAFHCTLWRVSG